MRERDRERDCAEQRLYETVEKNNTLKNRMQTHMLELGRIFFLYLDDKWKKKKTKQKMRLKQNSFFSRHTLIIIHRLIN